jgi:hypothetical protein
MRTIGGRVLPVFALVSMLALGSAQTVRATEIDKDGRVGADEVIDDDLVLGNDVVDMAGTVNGNLITGGTDVTISGTVNGDVIAGGSNVTITGTVNGNLFAMGGDIQLDGTVEDSLFFGGSSLNLGPNAKVGGNAYGAGFSISAQSGSVIPRDAAFAGYQVILAGEVGRDVRAAVGAFELTGKVGRNVSVDVGEPQDSNEDDLFWMQYSTFPHISRIVPAGLHISSEAVIGGKLDYYSAVEQVSGIRSAPEGGVVYHYRAPDDGDWSIKDVKSNVKVRMFDFGGMLMNYVFGVIREFLTLVLLGALAVWLIPSLLTKSAGILRDKPLPSLGWGILVLIVGLVGLVLACMLVFMLGLAIGVVTLFGLMSAVFGIGFSAVGLSGALFLAVAQYGTKLVVALLLGDAFIRLFRKDYSASAFWPLLLGILMLVFVDAIPILGTVVSLFVALLGLGAIWILFRNWWQSRGAKA